MLIRLATLLPRLSKKPRLRPVALRPILPEWFAFFRLYAFGENYLSHERIPFYFSTSPAMLNLNEAVMKTPSIQNTTIAIVSLRP
jgi:hypothetical protein